VTTLEREDGVAFPRWCDLECAWAEFPKEGALDGAGSCRTFAALHCRYLRRIVAKNAPCAARREAVTASTTTEGKGHT